MQARDVPTRTCRDVLAPTARPFTTALVGTLLGVRLPGRTVSQGGGRAGTQARAGQRSHPGAVRSGRKGPGWLRDFHLVEWVTFVICLAALVLIVWVVLMALGVVENRLEDKDCYMVGKVLVCEDEK